jgi:hypothetical protein
LSVVRAGRSCPRLGHVDLHAHLVCPRMGDLWCSWTWPVSRGSRRVPPRHGGGGLLLHRRWSACLWLVWQSRSRDPLTSPRWRGMVASETEPGFGHGGRWRRLRAVTLLKASLVQPLSPRPGCTGGNPRSGSPGSDNSDAQCPSPCWGHLFWSRCWLEVALRWIGVHLFASITVSLGSVASQSLDGGHGLRCARREEASSGAMVASSA